MGQKKKSGLAKKDPDSTDPDAIPREENVVNLCIESLHSFEN